MTNQLKGLAIGVVVLLLSAPIFSQTSGLNQGHRYTIESGVFKILQMPTEQRQGRVQIFESSEQQSSGCKSCGERFYFDNDLRIRVALEGSMFTVQDLAVFPPQTAYFVIENGDLVTVGFRELILDESAEAKLQSIEN